MSRAAKQLRRRRRLRRAGWQGVIARAERRAARTREGERRILAMSAQIGEVLKRGAA